LNYPSSQVKSRETKKEKEKEKMKSLALLATVCATAVLGAGREQVGDKAKRSITIEVAPGETRQITEEERWEIATVSFFLMVFWEHIPPRFIAMKMGY
jgi:hypothetical protein